MNDDFFVDIERPYQEIETYKLSEIRQMYALDDGDVELLAKGKVVWLNGVAISKSED